MLTESENCVTEIRFGRITAKALDVDGETILDVRRTGKDTLIFVGYVGPGKWPFLMMILEKLGAQMEKAGWLGQVNE
jgi:hypothetical protein